MTMSLEAEPMTLTGPTTTNERLFWRELVTCPVCGEALPDVHQCAHCGRTFDEDRGTPVLMHADAKRAVKYNFTADRSAPPPERLQKWLTAPGLCT